MTTPNQVLLNLITASPGQIGVTDLLGKASEQHIDGFSAITSLDQLEADGRVVVFRGHNNGKLYATVAEADQ